MSHDNNKKIMQTFEGLLNLKQNGLEVMAGKCVKNVYSRDNVLSLKGGIVVFLFFKVKLYFTFFGLKVFLRIKNNFFAM